MARLYPAILDPNTKSDAERRLYTSFARELADDWVVFHSVNWIGNDDMGRPRDGEADFVVAHPALGILTIEAKGGRISFDAECGHFISTDRGGIAHDIGDPFKQAMESKKTLLEKMRGIRGWPRRRIVFGHAVAFPDSVVEAPMLRPNAPRDIIIDAMDMVSLEQRLRTAFAYWRSTDDPPGTEGIDLLVRTLGYAQHIRHPLLSEQIRSQEQSLVELTEKQFRYLRFLNQQRRAAIVGCAGSGKTFLAVEKARRLAAEGHRVLFTCYNRHLADHIGENLAYRKQFDVFTFHQLCVHWARQAEQQVSSSQDGNDEYFDTLLPQALLAAIDAVGSQYDAIIVDEAQDFHSSWWEVLPWLLHDPTNGILYVFFDDNQRIYPNTAAIPIEMEPNPLDENCRNTQQIFRVVTQFYAGAQPPIPLGPDGYPVEVIQYGNPDNGVQELRRLLHRLLNQDGFAHHDIAVLTVLGATRSEVIERKLGNVLLTEHLPLPANGVLATTIRRFKGLERAVIILCEIDQRMTSEEVETLLYIGTSRARTYLVILVSNDAPAPIRNALTHAMHSGKGR
jgi:hypothetical protein